MGGFSFRHMLLGGFEPGPFRQRVSIGRTLISIFWLLIWRWPLSQVFYGQRLSIGLIIIDDVEVMVEKAAARWWVVMPA